MDEDERMKLNYFKDKILFSHHYFKLHNIFQLFDVFNSDIIEIVCGIFFNEIDIPIYYWIQLQLNY